MEKRCAHNQFTILTQQQIKLQISSNFDSGNLQSATLISEQKNENCQNEITNIKLQFLPAGQPFHPQYSQKQSNKSFFHFNIKSSKPILLHAKIRRMNILGAIESSFDQYYRLCVGVKKTGFILPQYSKIKTEYMCLTKNGEEYILQFKYPLNANQKIYFAYHYPYSLEKLHHFLQDLSQNLKLPRKEQNNEFIREINFKDNIYYKQELLIQSVEGRPINLLTITQLQSDNIKNGFVNLPREERISKTLFPYYQLEQRPYKFNKPYIMITCRVHPGETSASYALEGFINRLVGSSAEAQFLRRTFVFIIIPMLNPDGVFHGTYRMDMLGHNLNRFYNSSAAHKQPSIFAVQSLLQYHSQELVAFFDFHSHPQAKGSFLYGNAYASIHDQIESQTFAKLLSYNSQCFGYENCTFSEKNMNSKDINDILTKDGSARVCAYKRMLNSALCNGAHCFAIEFGYHGCAIKQKQDRVQALLKFKSHYIRTSPQFVIVDYEEDGAAVANTLAQIYIQSYKERHQISFTSLKNVSPSSSQQLEMVQIIRQQVSKQIYDKEQRFKIMDIASLRKLKNIHHLINSNIYAKIFEKYPKLQENILEYKSKFFKDKRQCIKSTSFIKRENVKSVRVVNSLQMNKQRKYDGDILYKKITCPNQTIEQNKITDIKITIKKQSKIGISSAKEKINILPMEFNIKPQRGRRGHAKLHQIFQRDSLPKIDNLRYNFISEKNKVKKKSEIHNYNHYVDQYLNNQIQKEDLSKKLLILSAFKRQSTKGLDNTLNQIVGMEQYINKQIINSKRLEEPKNSKLFSQISQHFHYPSNPEYRSEMSIQRNESEIRKQKIESLNTNKIQIKNITQRANQKSKGEQERNRSLSKDKKLQISKMNEQNSSLIKIKMLPKLPLKIEKINNKFDLQLKMKERYDKKFKVDEMWKIEDKLQG